MTEFEFQQTIRAELARNPEWLGTALAAITAGMSEAITAANQRASKFDLAFRSALSLADPARISKEAKAILSNAIVAAIPAEGGCEIERKTLQRLLNHAE